MFRVTQEKLAHANVNVPETVKPKLASAKESCYWPGTAPSDLGRWLWRSHCFRFMAVVATRLPDG